MAFCYALVYSLLTVVFASNSKNASITYMKETGKFEIHDFIAENPVAYGTFTDEIFLTGWSYLEVKTSGNFSDSDQAYAAGIIEGYLTHHVLKNHWFNTVSNYCNEEFSYCKRLKTFLQRNMEYLNNQIKDKRQSDGYWHQVALTLEQLHGVEDGYRNVTSAPSTLVDVMGVLLINLMGDLMDLERVLHKKVIDVRIGRGSCSALIKVLPNNKDIYFSHVTWTNYNTMLRILKKYSFKIHVSMEKGSPLVPGHTSSFSSYPGMLVSGDDFNLISSGLATMETTIDNSNNTLWQCVNPNSVLEWQRSIIANRLAKNGKQWAELFSQFNSGTYNNQWMILNYNKFQPGKPLKNGLFYVLEQLPGFVHFEEKTDELRKQGYWASYNVAYFEDIFNMSGCWENVKKFGDFFTHDKSPRALIFKRDQRNVVDTPSMMKLMRYNDYMNDPLSKCDCKPPFSADCAISARNDLNPVNGTYPFDALGHSQEGGTDMKLTTYELYQKLQFIAISGPTYDPLPPFQWSKTDFGKTVPHVGHPDLWKFEPIVHKWM